MAKAKKIDDKSLIHFNLVKLESKIEEFQNYLELNTINSVVTKDGEVELSLDAQDKLHKEIIIQIKMQEFLFSALPLLEKLKQKEVDSQSTRGDVEVGGLFKNSQ